MKEKKKPSIDLLKREFYPKKIKLSRKEFLDQLFLWYPVRIIGSELSVNNTMGFIALLKGLTELRPKNAKDKIEIIKFRHKGHYESIFSFVILVQGFSNMADYSQWYMFLEFCTNGSGMEGSSYNEVNKYLKENKKIINLKTIDIHPLYLHHYARDNLLKSNLEYASKLEDYKSLAKGTTFELFISYLFNLEGYETRWSVKKIFTGNREIDVLCFKKEGDKIDFLILEVSTKNDDIRSEIRDKINLLKQNQGELLRYLKLPENLKCKYHGKMITLNKNPKHVKNNIDVIDLDDLIKMCREKDINIKTIKKLIVEKKEKSLEEMNADEIVERFERNYYSNK